MRDNLRAWIVDVIFGGAVGVVIGAITALNIMIFFGTDAGYEAGLDELFEQRPAVAVIVVALLVVGPVLGVSLARRVRGGRNS